MSRGCVYVCMSELRKREGDLGRRDKFDLLHAYVGSSRFIIYRERMYLYSHLWQLFLYRTTLLLMHRSGSIVDCYL